jgi:hypothetical protein
MDSLSPFLFPINHGLISFATHGQAGTKAFWAHSVGAKVLAQTARPVLLVPIR